MGRRDGTARRLDGMEPNPPVVADRLRALNSIARARSALRDAKEALRRDVGVVVVVGVGNEDEDDEDEDDDRNLGTRRSAARAEESNLRRARRETKRAREEALRRGMKNARKARGEEENAAKTSTAVTREILGEVARGIADESRIREFERCASERGGAKAYEEMRRVVDEERRRISEACEEIISSCEGMKEGLPRDVEDVERVVGRCREALDAWSFERARVVEEYVRAGMAEEMRRESDALARRIDDVRSLVDSVIDGRLDL